VTNDVPIPGNEFASSRTFTKTAAAIRLQPFHGTSNEWLEHLERLTFPALAGRVSTDQLVQFRPQYLRRANTALTEINALHSTTTSATELKSSVERTIEFLRSQQ
jgi:hypothetical protein